VGFKEQKINYLAQILQTYFQIHRDIS